MKENKVGTTVVSRYEYGVNAIGRRSTLAASGSAFSAARNIGWSYNARGEVTSADHSDTEQSRFYQYDAIGNRMKDSINELNSLRDALDSGAGLKAVVSGLLTVGGGRFRLAEHHWL